MCLVCTYHLYKYINGVHWYYTYFYFNFQKIFYETFMLNAKDTHIATANVTAYPK